MNLTRIFIVIIVTVIFVVDAGFLALSGYNSTISWQLFTWSKEWPIIPFLIGVMMGHLFFPNRAANAVPPK